MPSTGCRGTLTSLHHFSTSIEPPICIGSCSNFLDYPNETDHFFFWGEIRYHFSIWFPKGNILRKLQAQRMLLSLQSDCPFWFNKRAWWNPSPLHQLGTRCRIQGWVAQQHHQAMADKGRKKVKVLFNEVRKFDVPNISQVWFTAHARLTSCSEFIRVNGPSPLTTVKGFSPWRA